VLVVDDEEDLLEVLQAELTDAGYDVAVARDAKEAFDRWACAQFDVVLTDLKMPGMNGLEMVTRMLRAEPRLGAVLMTGFASEEVRETLRVWGHRQLAKPFDADEMLDALRDELAAPWVGAWTR